MQLNKPSAAHQPSPVIHDAILEILFKHKKEVSLKLSDVLGLCSIDHFSITILGADRRLAVFSTTSSVECNLIVQNLWRYDKNFLPESHRNSDFFWWDDAYVSPYGHIIKEIKQEKHHYTLGFCMARKINGLSLVYSYATRNKEENIKEYSFEHKNQLLQIGDYGYNRIQDIYFNHYAKPLLHTPQIVKTARSTHLRLVINRTRSENL